MDHKEFVSYLKSLKLKDLDKVYEEDYEMLISKGIKYAFLGFDKEDRYFLSTFIKRFPQIFYNYLLRKVYQVEISKKIDNYPMEVKRINWEFHKYYFHQYVGPFFYINNHLRYKKMEIVNGMIEEDFINHPLSHFDLFNSINIDPTMDYGNFPRGRVIYNNMTNEFYIYLDKSINKLELIKDIKTIYNLTCNNVVVKEDEHYRSDDL